MVDSVLGVVNELLGTALSKQGPNPLPLASSPTPPSYHPGGWGYQGKQEGAEFRDLSLPPQTDEAATWKRSNGGVLGRGQFSRA